VSKIITPTPEFIASVKQRISDRAPITVDELVTYIKFEYGMTDKFARDLVHANSESLKQREFKIIPDSNSKNSG
jgi:hypothetical protein